MHYHTNVEKLRPLRAPLLAVAPFLGSLYTFPNTSGYWQQRSRAWCPCTPMSHAPKKTSILRSAAFKPVRVTALRGGEWCPILVQIYSSIWNTWLSLQTDYAIRPSWTPRNPAKSGRLIGCTPGYQVTPRLRALFHAGASGDSSPSHAFPRRGIRWLLAFARFSVPEHQLTPCTARASYRLEWVREQSPLHTTAADVRLVSCEWEGILYTRQPLKWGWYHENERVSSTHGRPLLGDWWGTDIVWIREQCLPNMTAADEGLVSWKWVKSQVIVLCTQQNAALRQGAACLDSGPCGFICGDMRTLSFCICPRLSAPPWKGDMRSWADVLSCRFDGWEECGHLVGMSS